MNLRGRLDSFGTTFKVFDGGFDKTSTFASYGYTVEGGCAKVAFHMVGLKPAKVACDVRSRNHLHRLQHRHKIYGYNWYKYSSFHRGLLDVIAILGAYCCKNEAYPAVRIIMELCLLFLTLYI